MTIYLRSDGVNDTPQFPDAITIASLGTLPWKCIYKGNITAPTGTVAIAGTSAGSTAAGPAVSTTGQMIIRSSTNVTVATSPAGFIIFGEDHKYECDHAAGGGISWKRDDVEIGTGSYTGTQAWTNINQFFRASGSATARLQADTEYIEFVGTVNANRWDANLSGGTGNVLPTTSGSNNANLVNFPTDGTQWVDTGGGGGTAQDITLVNAQQLVQAVQATVSTSQAIAAVNAEQLTQATLVAVSVSQAIAAVNAETAVQAVTANISAGQAISAVNAQQLVEALQVTITQGGATPAQDVTALPAQQLVESVQVSITANQNVTRIDAQQLVQAEQALVSMLQSITSLNAQQAVQALQVTVTQGGLPPAQDVTALPAQQLTEAVSAAIGFNQAVISTAAQQATEAVVVSCTINQGVVSIDAETDQQAEPAVVSMVQQITVAIAQQLTQAVRAGEVTAPPIIAAKVKVTLIPSRFTINIVN